MTGVVLSLHGWVTGTLCLTVSLPVHPWVTGILCLWADGSQASCVPLAVIVVACSCMLSPRFIKFYVLSEVSGRRACRLLQGSLLALYLLCVVALLSFDS